MKPKRIILVLFLFAALVTVGLLISRDASFVLAFALLLFLIPETVLLILTAFTAVLAILFFRPAKLVVTSFVLLLILQAVVLLCWIRGWTAVSAFHLAIQGGSRFVINPRLEDGLLIVFWVLAAFTIAVAVEQMVNQFRSTEGNVSARAHHKRQLGVLALESFLLLGLSSSSTNIRNSARDVNVPASVSSDGNKKIMLIPINAFIDTNGVIVVRQNALVSKAVGGVGDLLTEADGGRFVWASDQSQVYLLLNLRKQDTPVWGYDFREKKQVDPNNLVLPN